MATKKTKRAKTVHCGCGFSTGERCNWSGPVSETVLVDVVPGMHQGTARTLGSNRGLTERIRCNEECADSLVEHEPDYHEIVSPRRGNPTETAAAAADAPKSKKDAKFPWLGVGLGLAGLAGFYYLFLRPKTAVAATPVDVPAVAPVPPQLPVVVTPPIGVAVVTPATPAPVPATPVPVMPVVQPAQPVPGSVVNPVTGALIPLGSKFAAWAAFPDPATTWRWELGPMLDAYQALFPGNIPDGGIGRLPASSGSQICVLAQSVPFYTLNSSDYAAAVFFLNPTDTLDEVVMTATVQCAQSIASMLAQRGIRPVFTLVDGDDVEGVLKAAIAPVGGVVVTVPRTGATTDIVYESGARAVHRALYGVG